MKIIDIHTHILPNIDDGSDSMEKSIRHLQMVADAGVEKLVLTPHCMLGKYEADFLMINTRFAELLEEVKKNNINIELLLGAEVFCETFLIDKVVEEKLSLGNSNYVLFETSLNSRASDVNEFAYQLQRKGYRLILAHPERYTFVHKTTRVIESIMHRDILIQVNATSLLGYHGKKVKETAWKMLHKGYAHFVASDDHCRHNKYYLDQAYMKVVKHIDQHTADLLFYENPLRMLKNKEIDPFYVTVIGNKHSKRKALWKVIFGRH
ncbi:MAG: hypothetical protein B6226_02205 [Candidatus Cloacimonetes bacterium 4572_65]|nr:MAG: hypothetical protein B6226_02205 [Candidatus Cloacimonetes bacterium 4572_65]